MSSNILRMSKLCIDKMNALFQGIWKYSKSEEIARLIERTRCEGSHLKKFSLGQYKGNTSTNDLSHFSFPFYLLSFIA